ncbi:hypothetical protein WB894_004260 [Vibrio vulnificus]|nr:hypothetical protein [Vibrio vulnificus]EHH1191767.1 hypothetical protein [Vibrio vulnificus]EHU4850360.1 hypothetical protein [Vibrio vulnificus]EIA1304941.1 hypothetical protein [Vibrio vulnificus]EJE8536226.1 hypothetical protein [Vibrio vulnificus]
MTESTLDKTKRKLINHIKNIQPTHQTAIFFNNFDDAIEFNNLVQIIKKPVSAAFKHITMIWVLRLKYQFNYGTVGYIQILTNAELDLKLLNKVLAKYTYDNQINTKQRPFSYEKYTDTVAKQKLTNLTAYLGSQTSPRRYAITNKPRMNKNA